MRHLLYPAFLSSADEMESEVDQGRISNIDLSIAADSISALDEPDTAPGVGQWGEWREKLSRHEDCADFLLLASYHADGLHDEVVQLKKVWPMMRELQSEHAQLVSRLILKLSQLQHVATSHDESVRKFFVSLKNTSKNALVDGIQSYLQGETDNATLTGTTIQDLIDEAVLQLQALDTELGEMASSSDHSNCCSFGQVIQSKMAAMLKTCLQMDKLLLWNSCLSAHIPFLQRAIGDTDNFVSNEISGLGRKGARILTAKWMWEITEEESDSDDKSVSEHTRLKECRDKSEEAVLTMLKECKDKSDEEALAVLKECRDKSDKEALMEDKHLWNFRRQTALLHESILNDIEIRTLINNVVFDNEFFETLWCPPIEPQPVLPPCDECDTLLTTSELQAFSSSVQANLPVTELTSLLEMYGLISEEMEESDWDMSEYLAANGLAEASSVVDLTETSLSDTDDISSFLSFSPQLSPSLDYTMTDPTLEDMSMKAISRSCSPLLVPTDSLPYLEAKPYSFEDFSPFYDFSPMQFMTTGTSLSSSSPEEQSPSGEETASL